MKCSHQKSDGEKCKANAMVGFDYCFSHNPETAREHSKAVQKGGEATHNRDYIQLDPIPVEDALSVSCLLTDAINRIRLAKPDGTFDLKTANAIGFLSGKLLECKKQLLHEEDLLKNRICKNQKVDLATFRQLMQEYDKEYIENMGNFIEGAEQRYEEHKRTKDPAYLF